MKLKQTVLRSGLQLSTALAALLMAANLTAAPPRVLDKLETAYADLSSAKGDYSGHKAHAMDEIQAAAKELGTPLEKTGRVPEGQGESDAQLRDAKRLLAEVSDALGAHGRERTAGHLDRAIEEVNHALETR